MVQIFIRKDKDKDMSEWVMIELQGDLESKSMSSLAGSFMGDLHYNLEGVPILIIGHHILYGKVLDMDKPFAVLFKKTLSDNDLGADAKVKTLTEYSVRAIIKKKLVFKTRPKPIITNVAKKV